MLTIDRYSKSTVKVQYVQCRVRIRAAEQWRRMINIDAPLVQADLGWRNTTAKVNIIAVQYEYR